MTLRVTLSIVPFGDEGKERGIEVINISNLGPVQGTQQYRYGVEYNKYKTQEYDALVEHTRSDGAVKLVELALAALGDKA